MPTFYNFTENGSIRSFDDVFVPADAFRQGNLFSWGDNLFGVLGNNTSGNQSLTPVTTSTGGANWKQVSCGYYHAVAVKTDGTLWSWGQNSYGQLGTNGFSDSEVPITTFAGGSNWRQVSCGSLHSAAIKTDGTLWTWGRNIFGQLGVNASGVGNTRVTPVTTFAGGNNWKQVACGYQSTLAVKTDGTLWTWGRNGSGQLGDNTTTNKPTPAPIFGATNNWKQVTSGYAHSLAIKNDGTLWCWGLNLNGQLGINNTTQRNTPVTTFLGGTNWKQVASAVGATHTVATKTDGTLWTWGLNGNGQLGYNASGGQINTPITTFLGGNNWKQISCGSYHTSATKANGTLWTWGRNSYGQLGINNTTQRNTPVTTFLGGSTWKQVSCGYSFTIATTYIDDYI